MLQTPRKPVLFFCVSETMQNGEAKKEEFQRYLEKSGVIDALTKVLVGLYEVPEKPGNAIDFIKE